VKAEKNVKRDWHRKLQMVSKEGARTKRRILLHDRSIRYGKWMFLGRLYLRCIPWL
jgi:hypothetical protein